MAKKIINQVKILVTAGAATPSPPVGPALGGAGVNIPMFIKDFNAKTAHMKAENVQVPVIITVYSDKSFTYIVKPPLPARCSRRLQGRTRARLNRTRKRSVPSPGRRLKKSPRRNSPT